jgi:hypothetical protein
MDSTEPDSSGDANIEDLVAEALTRIENEGPRALEELCRAHPEQADALRERVEWLLETGLATPEPPGEQRRYPEQLGDFRLIEPIGHGGMGVVYRAEQLSLGREVALKLVRPEQLYFPGALARFQQEVTTVAGLGHPGIVPIFAVGEEDGVPFFAMEQIRGASLGALLETLQGRATKVLLGADLVRELDGLGADLSEEPSPLFDGAWPLVCTRLAREVAEALEHAHRRGVLHRDVKPSNVMITRGGRVMLVDFGLSSNQSASTRRTRTGIGVGTLAYMAPEQLRGERELDARVDVYSLGVTLYELLTLRLPFASSSQAERRDRADLGVPADLRKTDPRISWELETVVQTATDPDPARRYATAADLARDLSNVLESRPIEARRSSPLLRAQRWAQREPARAAGILLAVALIVGGPLVYAGLAHKAREGLREAYQREGDERRRAEESLEDAIAAIDEILKQGSDLEFATSPGVDPARRSLLERAVQLYESLLDRERDNETLVARTVEAQTRLSQLHAELGDGDAALALAERALAAVDGEAGAGLHGRDWLRWNAHFARLCTEHARGNDQVFREGCIAQRAVPDFSDPTRLFRQIRHRAILAQLLARTLQGEGDLDGVLAAMEDSISAWDQLLAQAPDDPELLSDLATALDTRAYFAGFSPLASEFAEDFPRATELHARSIELDPDDPSHRLRLGIALSRWAHLDLLHGRMAEAAPRAERANELLTELVDQYPLREGYIVNHLINIQRLSWSLRLGGDQPAGEAVLAEGIAAGQAADARFPESDWPAFYLAMFASELAHHLSRREELDRADELWPLAREMWTRLLDRANPQIEHMGQAGTFYSNLARHQLARGELELAEENGQTAIGWHTRMLERTGKQEHVARLGASLPLVARIQVARGALDEAVATLAEAVQGGFIDADDLRQDELTRALGERDDYRALLDELAADQP